LREKRIEVRHDRKRPEVDLRTSNESLRGRRIFTSLDRINAFSDGVFAVAITLLVLSIAVPALRGAHTNANLWHSLSSVWGLFFSYVLSFWIIGTFWYRHHDLFDRLETADSVMVYLNILLLLVIAFIPFTTSLMGKYGDISLAVAIYTVTMALTCILLGTLCLYCAKGGRLVGKDFDFEFTYHFTIRYVSMVLVFLGAAGIAFINASAGLYFLGVLFVVSPLLNRLRPFHASFIKWVSSESEDVAAA
jgi:uncharacterized membrane protein